MPMDEKLRRKRTRWLCDLFEQRRLTARLDGSVITLTATPEGQEPVVGRLDLRAEFPGAYLDAPWSWDRVPLFCDIDAAHGAVAVGPEERLDDREHVRLTDIMFGE